MTRRRRAAFAVVVGAPVALVCLVGVQVVAVTTAEYLPAPDYRVAATVGDGDVAPLRLAVLGDSTVAGIGADTADASLAGAVAERVAAELGRPVAATGFGVSGARTDDVRAEQAPRLAGAGFDAVLVVIGSNDVTHVAPPWSFDERTRRMLDVVAEQADAPVVLGGIPEFATVPAFPQPLRALSAAYADWLRRVQLRATAAAGVRHVDIAAEASPRFIGRPESMSSDGFHPSAIGYGLWADALAPAVAEALTAPDGAAATLAAPADPA